MHFYPFHISDWALHTSHLTLIEDIVYRRLLDFYYETEKPIPEETQWVIRRLRLGSESVTVASILEEFFELEGDGWHNLRADFEISEYKKKADRARVNGKKGGRPKKTQGSKTQRVILANPEETGSKANHEPLPVTNNHEPVKTYSPEPQATLDESVVMTIPTLSFETKGEVFRITDTMITEWQDTYPLMEVEQELKRAVQWSRDNPGKRKTLRGMKRYLGSWLSRKHDKGYANENANGHFRQNQQSGRLSAGDRVRAKAAERQAAVEVEVGPIVGGAG